jgi:hypothetical protein
VVIFLITKIVRRRLFKRWWVKLDPRVGVLIAALENLELDRPLPRAQRRVESERVEEALPPTATVQRVAPPSEGSAYGHSDAQGSVTEVTQAKHD